MRCPLCFLNQKGSPFGLGEMPFDMILQHILKNVSTLQEVIPSTMGEPLLYKYFTEFLMLCQSLWIPVNLTTNGSFPGYESKDKMNLLLSCCSDIKISAMGFSEKTFSLTMPGLSFENWKKNVEALCTQKQNLLSQLNCREFEKIAFASFSQEHRDSVLQACTQFKNLSGAAVGCDAVLKMLSKMLSKKSLPSVAWVSKISLQVTLHQKNLDEAMSILEFAHRIGISRIKWNRVVFLSTASPTLRAQFDLNDSAERNLKTLSEKILQESQKLGIVASGNIFEKIKSARNRLSENNLLSENFISDFAQTDSRQALSNEPRLSCKHFAGELWVLPNGKFEFCPNPERRFVQPEWTQTIALKEFCKTCPLFQS